MALASSWLSVQWKPPACGLGDVKCSRDTRERFAGATHTMPLCAGCKLSRFRQRHTTGVPPDLSKRDMHQPWELNPTASVSRCQRQWLDSMCSVASSMDGWNVLSHASQDNKPPLTAGMEACIRARRSVRRENVQAATALTGVEHKYLSRQYDKR